eukprot:gene5157-6271_t
MDEMNNKEICDYEAERNKRIQENRKRMVELGLMQTVTNFKALVQTPRVSKMEAPNYREIENAANLHTVDLRRAWTKECTPTDNNSDLDDPLIPRVPVTFRNASNDWPREREVLQRATPAERATLLNRGPAFVKLMLPSHVAGGYWLQAPFGIHEHLPVDSCQILLMCGSEEWEVVWLMPKKGMSGGWRGFAVDQRLVVGDALVFQKLEGCRVGVRIYRVAQLGSQAAAADAAFDDAEQATAALFAPTNPVESSEQDTGTAAEMHAKERPVTLAKDESAVVEDEKAEAQEADASIAPQQPLPKTKNRRSSSQAKLTDGDHWKSMKRLVSCHDKKRPAGDGKRKYGKSDHQSEKMEGRQLIGRRVSCYWAAEKQWFSERKRVAKDDELGEKLATFKDSEPCIFVIRETIVGRLMLKASFAHKDFVKCADIFDRVVYTAVDVNEVYNAVLYH